MIFLFKKSCGLSPECAARHGFFNFLCPARPFGMSAILLKSHISIRCVVCFFSKRMILRMVCFSFKIKSFYTAWTTRFQLISHCARTSSFSSLVALQGNTFHFKFRFLSCISSDSALISQSGKNSYCNVTFEILT